MNRRQFSLGLGAVALTGPYAQSRQESPPQLVTADYEELGRIVRRQTGKVVLVDLWRHD